MKRIVFGSANHWTSPYQVGSHAWARLFAGHGWKTAYISDPLSPWHAMVGKNREQNYERFRLWRSGGELFEEGGVTAWTPGALITPYHCPPFHSRWVLTHWDRFAIPSIHSRMKKLGFDRPDLLWLDSVRHASWGERLAPRFTVLRIADWSAGFPNASKSALEKEERLIGKADWVITTAKTLEERVRRIRGDRPLHTIRNGVDVSFWSQPSPEPSEYAKIPSPRAVYVGALDAWFDSSLLCQAAKQLPRVSFVLIGQRKAGFGTELCLPNIHWLGARPRDEVRGLLQHAQVGIIPFKRNELIECVCPLKLYEFMACGLPVVSSRWDELERMDSPAYLAGDIRQWILSLEEALGSPSARANSITYAAANDWRQRWAYLESVITRNSNSEFD